MALNVDEVFDPSYLADLGDLSLNDLRAKRQVCAELETDLSYLRRLAQARVDLILAELERRHLGLSEPAPEALVDQLPQILSDHTHAAGLGRLPTFFAPEMFHSNKSKPKWPICSSNLLNVSYSFSYSSYNMCIR